MSPYRPIVDGFSDAGPQVCYRERASPPDLAEVVHVFWELRTLAPLGQDFLYHAVPDACVNVLFNQVDLEVAGVTALHTQATTLNLGTTFHYVGVQLLPGAWCGHRHEIQNRYVGTAYTGELPLVPVNKQLLGLGFDEQAGVLAEFVRWCVARKWVQRHSLMATILSRLDDIRSVAEMAAVVGLSTRQLQRSLRQATGFAPHDLLKVLRLQQSFRRHYLDLYADQAHFTHAFRRAVGFSPAQYRKAFDVRSVQDDQTGLD